jgi:hypothetical protein
MLDRRVSVALMGLGSMMAGGNPAEKRQDRDWYPTPTDVPQALLTVEKFEGTIFECACGDGVMAKVFEAAGHKVIASDIEPQGYGMKVDFFTVNKKLHGVNVITNPPFDLSVKFIEHALSLEPESLALVLKSTYWNAKTRSELFYRTKPTVVYPLTWRPDFLGKGRPTMDVCWTVWRRGNTADTIFKPLARP